MKLRVSDRSAATLAVLAIAIGMTACGSSDASGDSVVPPVPAASTVTLPAPTTTVPATTVSLATTTTVAAAVAAAESPTTTDNILVVTDAEVADLEKQLDEIDQLLAGIDADLSQD